MGVFRKIISEPWGGSENYFLTHEGVQKNFCLNHGGVQKNICLNHGGVQKFSEPHLAQTFLINSEPLVVQKSAFFDDQCTK